MSAPLTLSGWLRYDVVRRRIRTLPIQSVLEVGPGVGAMAVLLARDYDYVGVELDSKSAEIARRRLAALGCGRVVHGTVSDVGGAYDLVCAFEVLEHIEDDAAALRQWRDRLRPGGWLILSVPAGPHRWGAHDERAGHFRRYTREQIEVLLTSVGFDTTEIACYGFPLLTGLHPVWNALSAFGSAPASMSARTHESGRFRQPPAWLATATRCLATPFALIQRPFLAGDLGPGLVAVARRRGGV